MQLNFSWFSPSLSLSVAPRITQTIIVSASGIWLIVKYGSPQVQYCSYTFCLYAHLFYAKRLSSWLSICLLCRVLHTTEKKMLGRAEETLSIAGKCLAEQKNKPLSMEQKCLAEPISAQQRRKTARQGSSVHKRSIGLMVHRSQNNLSSKLTFEDAIK